MKPRRIVVLGGGGFVGRHLVARLAAAGHRVVVPARRREAVKHLILLPTVDVVEADVHERATLVRLLTDADVAVNLVGVLHESGRDTFARVHVDLVRKLVDACATVRVGRLLHMSALGAALSGPSQYLRTKAEAEAIVEASDLDWTIFRPSVIFGPEDAFLNMFARLMRWLPIVALASPNARFAPVYVGDVAHCFAQSVDDDRTARATYALCGPRIYTLRELVAYAGRLSGSPRPIIALGPGLSRLQATILEALPGKLMTRDNLKSMERDNVCAGPFPPVFGIAPTPVEVAAPEYLTPGALHSAFDRYRVSGSR
jgi:uncharacterized protein YbjT (DUF2867 family)